MAIGPEMERGRKRAKRRRRKRLAIGEVVVNFGST